MLIDWDHTEAMIRKGSRKSNIFLIRFIPLMKAKSLRLLLVLAEVFVSGIVGAKGGEDIRGLSGGTRFLLSLRFPLRGHIAPRSLWSRLLSC